MPFFVTLLTSLALQFGIYLLTGFLADGRKMDAQKGNFPTADPDKFLPMIWGTVRLPINVFRNGYINPRTEKIERTRNIIFGWGPKDTIGHRYYYTFGAWLCHGKLDGFLDVIIDGKYFLSRVTPQQVRDDDGVDGAVENTVTDASGNTVVLRSPAYSTPTPQTGSCTWFSGAAPNGINIDIKVPALFGDPVGPGGVQGRIKLYPGDGYTVKNDALSAITPLGSLPDYEEPAYPEYAHVTFEDVWLGNSGNPPGVEFVVSRSAAKLGFGNPLNGYPNSPWGGANNGFAQGDCNPIGIIYEILVSSKLGIRFPRALIDFGSFEGAYFSLNPDTAGDFFGLSGAITDQTTGEEALKLILAHIDAVLYMDPSSGKLCIRLIREYGGDPMFLPLLDESNLLGLEWAETVQNDQINRIEVEFTNVYRDLKTDLVKVDNLAAIQRAGHVNAKRMQFLWCTRPELALKIGQRELRVQTAKIGRGTFQLNRTGMMLTPGQHVRVTHPDVGTNVVCRIGSIDIGTLADGRVAGTIMQDRWLAEASSYVAPAPSDTNRLPGVNFYAPTVNVAVAGDTTISTVYNLIVGDPFGVVTAVEYAIQYGDDPVGPWVVGSGPPYALEVIKTAESFRAFWRVSYEDLDGVAQEPLVGDFPPPVASIEPLAPPQLQYTYSGTDVIVTATISGFATEVRFASAIDSVPSDAAVAAGTVDAASPFTYTTPAPTGTQILYVGAVASDGTSVSPVARRTIPPKPGAGASAPSAAKVVLAETDAAFPSGEVLTAGTNTSIDRSTPGLVKVNASGGGATIGTAVLTTGTLADGATETGTLSHASFAKRAFLQKIVASAAIWVRFYETAAARTADAARLITTSPKAGLGILSNAAPGLDAAGLTMPITPAHEVHNGDGPRAGTIYYAVTNKSGGSAAITLTFTFALES